MSVLGDMNKKRTARTEIVSVLMDQDAAAERTRLEVALMDATNADEKGQPKAANDGRLGKPKPSADTTAAREALDAHLAKMADAVVHIRITALPNHRWRQLQAGHPPRRNHPADEAGYHSEEVVKKVLEISSHVSTDKDDDESWESPDADEVKEFMAELPGGEFTSLFWTIHRLHEAPINTEGLKKG
jgi:hypothetical protein